jgi:hypothetical protein
MALMEFVTRYAMRAPGPPGVRIRPETLSRCERMVGEAAYMRWYLRAMYGDLHT